MHQLSERVLLEGLLELGLVTGGIDEMLEKRIGFLFMPHGLGHFIGLDCHDVGGYLQHNPKRSALPGLKNLRTARAVEANNMITIEPGCYFREFLLTGQTPEDFYKFDLSHVNLEKIREYMKEICGVRIEDVVLVTETGNENLSFDIPRTVEQIEACMAGNDNWRSV